MSVEDAVDSAFENFGDIEDLIDQINYDDHQASDESFKVDIDHDGVRVGDGKKLRIDNSGVFINDGKTLSIDENGMSVNDGKFFKADSHGVQMGKLKINDEGISVDDNNVTQRVNDYFDKFDQEFDDNIDTEIYVESLKLVNEKTFDLSEIENLDVNYKFVKVAVLPTDGSQLVLREYMSRDNPNYYAHTKVSDGVISIHEGNYPKLLPLKVRVQLLVPNNFIGGLRLVNYAGTATLADLKGLKALKIELKSGNTRLKNISADNLAIIVKSGSARLSNVKSNQLLKINVSSGTIKFNNLLAQEFDITDHSGSIRGNGLVGSGRLQSHSGSVSVGVKDLTGDLNLDSKSGTIKVYSDQALSYKFDLSANSGTVVAPMNAVLDHQATGFKDGYVGESAQFTIKAVAKSGTIKLR